MVQGVAGAKSALDPHVAASVTPYVIQDLPDLDLTVTSVITVTPERTFCRQGHDFARATPVA